MNQPLSLRTVTSVVLLVFAAGVALAEYPDPERYRKVINAFSVMPQP